jgi:hypothetical protein
MSMPFQGLVLGLVEEDVCILQPAGPLPLGSRVAYPAEPCEGESTLC